MADEIKPDVATQEEVKETVEVDENAEIVSEIETFEKKENAREGFLRRKSLEEEEENTELSHAVQKELAKVMPDFKASTELIIDQKINALSDEPSVRKLTKLHFEKSINPDLGTLDERIEAAHALATRKKKDKMIKELTVATQNRGQIQNASVGQNSEVKAVSDGLLSDNQLNELKRRGWNDEKIIRFKKNLIKNQRAI